MNFYKNLTLLQSLAQQIDAGTASELESQAFDALLEVLNEQNKIRNTGTGFANVPKPRDGFVAGIATVIKG